MIKLYDAFKAGDTSLLDEVIDDIETADSNDYEEESGIETISMRTSTEVYVMRNINNQPTLQTSKKDDLKVATKVEFNNTNQNYNPKLIESIKTIRIPPSTDDKLNQTKEHSNMQHSRNQNERKIRHKEDVTSGVISLHISKYYIIQLLYFYLLS
ncbi:unnamed protein product [Onchocerca ochengi]|uniref:Uncharacterized protein n=1 Tax=Onchocerca ochengi TaxID=42157 RepID=A0A182ETW2_ONCOC|nr:unnamed protein product [Onchocerca ochengi]